METKIFGSILTLDRSPETYKTWWIGSFGEDAGDLQLVDEGREDGVGGWVWTNEINNNVPVKSVKEIRKFWSLSMSQNPSYFPYIMQQEE